jgi:hypothetical protein
MSAINFKMSRNRMMVVFLDDMKELESEDGLEWQRFPVDRQFKLILQRLYPRLSPKQMDIAEAQLLGCKADIPIFGVDDEEGVLFYFTGSNDESQYAEWDEMFKGCYELEVELDVRRKKRTTK